MLLLIDNFFSGNGCRLNHKALFIIFSLQAAESFFYMHQNTLMDSKRANTFCVYFLSP